MKWLSVPRDREPEIRVPGDVPQSRFHLRTLQNRSAGLAVPVKGEKEQPAAAQLSSCLLVC